jgi:integrase
MGIFRKQNAWWIDYMLPNGKRKREKVGPSRKQAVELLNKRRVQIMDFKEFPSRFAQSRLFKDVLNKFWKLHGSTLRSARTWGYIQQELLQRFGGKRIGSISPTDIQAYYNEVRAKTCSTTANKRLTYTKLIFNRAKQWGDFHGENPCGRYKVDKVPDREYEWRFLSHEEMDRLLQVAHPRLRPVLCVALMTGMRRGEILDLDWRNVDLRQSFIYILRSKSNKRRNVPVPNKLREMFLSLGPKPDGRVFNLPYISLRKYFARALRQADIKGRFRFHDLRHTFASHYAMTVRDLAALQNILGHSTPLLTMRYAHLSNRHLVVNSAAFESAIPMPDTDTLMTPSPAQKTELNRIDVVKSR